MFVLNSNICYATLEQFIHHWDGVRLVTLKILNLFKDEELKYRLVPQWRTVGELFHHIGGHQYFVARGVLQKRWNPKPSEPDMDWVDHIQKMTTATGNLSRWLQDVQNLVREWCVNIDTSLLEGIRDDNPWHRGVKGWLLLHHAYQDELHHRGQLTAIARLLGKEIPSVFAEEHQEFTTYD
jgi:uncharacterized damage-inducible protein DinB